MEGFGLCYPLFHSKACLFYVSYPYLVYSPFLCAITYEGNTSLRLLVSRVVPVRPYYGHFVTCDLEGPIYYPSCIVSFSCSF